MMEPKISVVVPIYNIEKYLLECLESIAAQTLKDIQVLLVDDGSKDSSAKICKEFIDTHPNFEYYYKENGGTASARNVGLEHAKGEYIGFVDSDDWIEPNMFEIMYQTARNVSADIVYCRMKGLADYIHLPKGIYKEREIQDIIYPAILPHVVESGTFRTVDWGNCSRLYKRSLVRGNHIRFYEKSRRCEDFAFAVECTLHAKCYVVLDEGELYHYRPNENSKSRAYTKNMWKSIQSLMSYMIEMTGRCKEYDFTEAMNVCIFYFCTSVIRNEAKLRNNKERIARMQEVIRDSLCINAISKISDKGMNKEYATLYMYMKKQDAVKLNKYLKQLAWKKHYVMPLLDIAFRNQMIKKLYKKIRGR
ncbi:glycosyltransferase [Dorea sp. YH-dor226]